MSDTIEHNYDFYSIAHLCLQWVWFSWHYHCLGIGGSLPLEAVPYPRESPSEKHPKRGFKGRPKTPLNFPKQQWMWIGWIESNFTNPTVKFWADFDNPFKRSDYAKLCMSHCLDGTLPEYVISQEDNSPLTLYIDFQNFNFFFDINSPFDQVHS